MDMFAGVFDFVAHMAVMRPWIAKLVIIVAVLSAAGWLAGLLAN